jgi:hypothetical protein
VDGQKRGPVAVKLVEGVLGVRAPSHSFPDALPSPRTPAAAMQVRGSGRGEYTSDLP